MFIHITVSTVHSFLLMSSIPWYRHAPFVYPLTCWVDIWLFPLSGYYTESFFNIHVQIFVWTSFFLGIYLEMERVDQMVVVHFKFLRNCPTHGCIILHSHQKGYENSSSFIFLSIHTFWEVYTWYFIVVSTCNTLND